MQVWNYAGGVGPWAYSFAARFGVGGHNMIGQPDAWNTVGLSNAALLNYYGVPAKVRTTRACVFRTNVCRGQ